jgi:hypothetical protein
MVTVQVAPPETAPVQVLAEMVNAPAPVSVTVGVTEPEPMLLTVNAFVVVELEATVPKFHAFGETVSAMNVCCPVTVMVATAVDPPFTAVAVT